MSDTRSPPWPAPAVHENMGPHHLHRDLQSVGLCWKSCQVTNVVGAKLSDAPPQGPHTLLSGLERCRSAEVIQVIEAEAGAGDAVPASKGIS